MGIAENDEQNQAQLKLGIEEWVMLEHTRVLVYLKIFIFGQRSLHGKILVRVPQEQK